MAGLALAGVIIFSGSALGLLNARSSGLLSVLLTDPPNVPDGVTAVFITYSDIALHAEGFADSGWVSIPGAGSINSLSLVNVSQTISSGTIPSLTYNQVRFTISAASVEFNGKNYTVTLGSGELEVPITGGLKVNSSDSTATLIDFQPTVLNLGNDSSPSFTISAGARALQVPLGEVDESTHVIGHKTSLQGHGWFDLFKERYSDNLTISGLTLSGRSLSFTATNKGAEPFDIRMVMVTKSSMGAGQGNAFGMVMNGAVFAVQTDGALTLVNGPPGEDAPLLQNAGFSLGVGATHSFSYAGMITDLASNHSIIAGSSYYVVVIGSGMLSMHSVVAT